MEKLSCTASLCTPIKASLAFFCFVVFLLLISDVALFTNSSDYAEFANDSELEYDEHNDTSECSHDDGEATEESNSSCPTQDHLLEYRFESIKRDILSKLNMPNPPNIDHKIPQVPRLLNLIQKVENSQNSYEDESKSTLMLFGKPTDDDMSPDNECHFQLRSDLYTKRIEKVLLGLYVRKPRRYDPEWSGWLLISFENKIILKKKISMATNDTNRWYTFNITSDSRDWFLLRKSEIHMRVVGSGPNGKALTVVKPLNEIEGNYRPYLFLKVKDQTSSRLKRTLNDGCEEDGAESRCCRYSLNVTFGDMGWNWIIHPKYYDAYYCHGDCPVDFKRSYVHSRIKESVIDESKKGLKCCTGRKFGPLSIIYFDLSGNIIVSRLPNMVVEQCECI